MSTQTHKYTGKRKASFYSWVAIVSGLRTCMGFPLEQPFEAAKTIWQAEPHHKNELALVKSIYQRNGLSGFYRGSVANIIRVTTKSLYRYPLVMFFQGIFDKMFPGMENNPKQLTKVKGLAALCVANTESIIVTPLERLKVFFMTRTVFSGGYASYISGNIHHLRKELFRGLFINIIRQNVSWLVWLETDAWSRMYIRKKYNIGTYEKSIPFMKMLPIALLTSIVNVLAVMPFDMLKTNVQKEEPDNVKTLIQKYAHRKGIKYLFVGWRVRLVQYFIQNVFTMNMLESMEFKYRQIKKKYGLDKEQF